MVIGQVACRILRAIDGAGTMHIGVSGAIGCADMAEQRGLAQQRVNDRA